MNVHQTVNELAGIREMLEPITSGKITRGHVWIKGGDWTATPGPRKTRLSDARKIAERMQARLNRLINDIEKSPEP